MKILHTSDWHLGAYVGPQCDSPGQRMENTRKCLKVLIDTAKAEKPDIILVAGDIFHQARVWSDRALVEVRVAADYLNMMSTYAPVVVLYGTPNHDGEQQFQALMQMTNAEVHYFMEPGIKSFKTAFGPIQIAGLPGFDKGHFRAQFPGLSAEEENQVFSNQLSQIVQGLSAQMDPTVPNVLMAHQTVVGCELDNGQHVFQANEVVLTAATLDNSNFDLVCLGHIHRGQCVGEPTRKPIFYSGSIDATNFNEEDHIKGFWIHDTDHPVHPKFIETPAREFITERWSQEECQRAHEMNFEIMGFENKVVRILYTCDSKTEKVLDKKKLERDIYAASAYYVSEIRPEKVTASVNREGMTEKLTVGDCLTRYLKEKEYSFGEAAEIIDIALPIIEQAQASTPMGITSGLFLPVEISVRNYRSYAAETFSFEDIFFAMVNGKNGSGKSSLFMDAITDCLYEETREKELTGWIRNDTKSGSISFTFRLGADLWRVTRTRQMSGKATLALAKGIMYFADYGDEKPGDSGYEWEDHSCERLNDTQQKIIDLLGMDCDTFQSCVLIMQDRYGKFMEADKSERMAVLANLLGLGIYDELLKITKDKLTDANRDVRDHKSAIDGLEADVAVEDRLLKELQQTQTELEDKAKELEDEKNNLSSIHAKLGAADSYDNEAAELKKDLQQKTDSYTDKKARKTDLENRAFETESFLKEEQYIIQRASELDAVKLEIAGMDGKLKMLEDKRQQCSKANRELIAAQGQQKDIENRLDEIDQRLVEKPRLEGIVEGNTAEAELEEYEKKAAEHRELNNRLIAADSAIRNYRGETIMTARTYEDKLSWLENQSAMLDNSDCVDIANARCKFLRSAKEADVSRKSIREEFEAYEAERKLGLSNLTAESEKIAADIDALAYDRVTHSVLIQTAKEYRDAKDKLAKLAADSATKIELEKQEGELESRVVELENSLEKLSFEVAMLEQETKNHKQLALKMDSLQRYEELKMQIPQARQFAESTVEAIKQLSADITELTAAITKINTRLNELDLLTIDRGGLYAKKLDAEADIQQLEMGISVFNQQVGTINARLATISTQRQRLTAEQEELKVAAKQAAQLQVLVEAFSQDGIPYQIIRDIVPELEAAANEILSQMTGGRMRLEFMTEKVLKSNKAKEVATLEIIISDVDNGVLPYLSRSGGQKVRAALAVNFALAMIKASRVGLQLGMLFIDEPPGLDEEGIEGYCSALETIHYKYPDMRILAISHDERMKARFAQQIFIETSDNGSKVRRQ